MVYPKKEYVCFFSIIIKDRRFMQRGVSVVSGSYAVISTSSLDLVCSCLAVGILIPKPLLFLAISQTLVWSPVVGKYEMLFQTPLCALVG